MLEDNTIPYLQEKLIKTCTPQLNSSELELLNNALNLLTESTKDIKRASGEAYACHPIRVAIITRDDISLSFASIIAALFHDAIQDEHINHEEIQKRFGEASAKLLKGLIKISTLYTEKLSLHSENFIALILTITSDVRVVMLKLADRLDNIRNIRNFDDEKQIKIAQETRLIYAPIAHRLGLYHIKTELEDISLRHTDSNAYFEIARQLKDTKKAREDYIEKFTQPIRDILDQKNIQYEIKGRPKSVNSIYGKLTKKNIDISEIFDLFAIRIILNDTELEKEKEACWSVYSLVTNIYSPNPTRLRDWISTPRPSGYESLHTTVMGEEKKWVEIQIRTHRMDEIAEKGNAAHWKYKESTKEGSHESWLRQIRDALEAKNEEAIDKIKSKDTKASEIFVFTPEGDIKKLREGAIILDFAYSIHSNIGNTCTGARVNEKIVPIKHKLKNGDTVEIITSKKQRPRLEWLNIVASPRTKSRIRRSISEYEFKQAEIGKEILDRRLSNLKIDLADNNILKMISHFKYKRALDFYQDVAEDKVDIQKVKEYLISLRNEDEQTLRDNEPIGDGASKYVHQQHSSDNYLIIDENLVDIDYNLAKCCRPIPGDNIYGFVTIERGIQVHRKSCPNAKDMCSRYPYRVVQTQWTDNKKSSAFLVEIVVTGIDKIGIINHISEVISKDHQVNMRSIAINTKDGMFQGFIAVFVNSLSHLDILLTNINKIKGVLKAERLDKK